MRGKRRKGLVLLGLILVLCLSGCGKKQVEDTVNIRVGSLKGPDLAGASGADRAGKGGGAEPVHLSDGNCGG